MSIATQLLPIREIVTPASADAAAEAVRAARASQSAVYPLGGGTGFGFGAMPTREGLGLSLSGLARVIDHPHRDLTITVEAGMTVAALARQLAEHGQRLPVDIPQADRATIGGAVACGASGPRRYTWGTLRDYVIGLSAVDGCGNLFAAGGRVVKNAAGYDLCRLLTGSLGTLAVLTQVTLMVKPGAETTAFVVGEVPDFAKAEELLAATSRSRTLPAAVELLFGPAWQDDEALGPRDAPAASTIAVGFEGTRAEVAWQVEKLLKEWGETRVARARALDADQAAGLWSRLTEFPAASQKADGEFVEADRLDLPPRGPEAASHEACRSPSVVIRASVLPDDVAELCHRLREADPDVSLLAHAGSGVVVARLAAAPSEARAVVVDRVRPAAASLGGHAVVVDAPPEAALDRPAVWGPAPSGLAGMQAIKSRFDPDGILNPGRFVYEDA